MNILKRWPSFLPARAVCRPNKTTRQLTVTDWGGNFQPARIDIHCRTAAPLSTSLTLCGRRHESGTVPPLALTVTETKHFPHTHPGFRLYISRSFRREVSKNLFDLSYLQCWLKFAEHAAVTRDHKIAASLSWLHLTRILAKKQHNGCAKTRPNEELSKIRFASVTDTQERNLLFLLSLYNVISFLEPRIVNVISTTDRDNSVTPGIPRLLNKLRDTLTPKVKQESWSCSLLVKNRTFLWPPQARRIGSRSSRQFHTGACPEMAKSKFEYVRQFETDDPCLQNCWVVVRIDGKAFHKFTDTHHYMKPNDERGLSLMTRAAQTVMSEFNEIVLAYGQSDEYSFVFHKHCKLYNRRASKIMTNVVSLFASSFTLFWPRFFNSQELQYPPSFDGRVVLYPSDENLRDYLSWRQADCHINNLYNTCFWKLVQEKGLTPNRAAERLKGTLSSDKNELLFSEFNINYNNLPDLYRKGSVIIRPKNPADGASPSPGRSISNHTKGHDGKANKKPGSIVVHTDIIGKKFWEENPHILNSRI